MYIQNEYCNGKHWQSGLNCRSVISHKLFLSTNIKKRLSSSKCYVCICVCIMYMCVYIYIFIGLSIDLYKEPFSRPLDGLKKI